MLIAVDADHQRTDLALIRPAQHRYLPKRDARVADGHGESESERNPDA